MLELQSLRNLIYKLRFDEGFKQRNLSAIVQIIPYIGDLIDANIFQEKKDEKLDAHLKKLDEISKNVLNYEDASDIINIIELHTLTINKILTDFKSLFNEENLNLVDNLEPIRIGISFVDQDIEIATKIIKELSIYNITFITNSRKIKNKNCLFYNSLPFKVDSLLVLYSDNYEKYNSSSYNTKTFLNSSFSRKIPSIVYAYQSDNAYSKLTINEYSKRYFKDDYTKINFQDYFLIDYQNAKKKEREEINSNVNIESILKQYNSDYKKIDSYKKDSIGYELYLQNQLTGKKSYCLYLYDTINSKKTIEYIISKHTKSLFENIFVLINKPKIKNPEERVKYLNKIFSKTINIIFIEDFVWEKLTSKYFDSNNVKEIPIQNFVEPFMLYENKKIDGFNFIDNWLNSEKNPILILTGSGGIGKTTLASKIANKINSKNTKTNAIFIDAIRISSTIKQLLVNEDNIDLYSFYKAHNDTSFEKLNYELFKINIDFGNIVIIIDGLDEIISRLGDKFNIDNFFESIHNFTNNIGNGKVILTSRNYFWDNSSQDITGVEIIDILPFDIEKTKQFFRNYFPHSEKQVEKALKITNSIIDKDYLPYVLELVRFMIEDSNDDGKYFDPDFESEILNQNNKNDFVLGKFCVRETQRVSQVSVDLQLMIFFEIANRTINKDEFSKTISNLLANQINNKQLEVFKSHPFLEINSNNDISFKYDFFKNHIKNIYLGFLLRGKIELQINHIYILGSLITYNSSFSDDLCDRIDKINDENTLLFLSLIESIKNFNHSSIKDELKRKAVSSIFIVLLKKQHSIFSNNAETNTELMKKIFETKNNEINYLNIYDLSSSNSNKIIFNFKGLLIKNSSFSSYDYFWECNFDNDTIFDECSYHNLNKEDNYNTSAKKSNFTNTRYEDSDFTEIINHVGEKIQNRQSNIMQDIHSFISIFSNTSGNIENKVYSKITQKYKPKQVTIDKMIKTLTKINLIELYHHDGIKYLKINDEYKSQIIKYYSNRITTDIIKKAFTILNE